MATQKSGSQEFSTWRHAVFRTLQLLAPERSIAFSLAISGALLGCLQVAEPLVFGRAVQALARNENSLHLTLVWGAITLSAFISGLVISVLADRMAHRRRAAAMENFLGHVLALPVSFHSRSQAGRLMRTMTSGSDTLFSIWLPLFREQLPNFVTLAIIVPIAAYSNWRLAILLGLIVAVYICVNILVILHTSAKKSRVEEQFLSFSGRASDLVGNVSVLQSFMAVGLEMRVIKTTLDQLLATQYPVLNWWAASSVFTRGMSSLSVVAIFTYGTILAREQAATIGDIVAFIGFTLLLIGRLDQTTNFLVALFMKLPALVEYFSILDERPEVTDRPGAQPLIVNRGHVTFDNVTFRYPKGSGGVENLSFEALPGDTVAIVGETGSGKSTALALLTRAYDLERGRILVDGQDIRDVTLASLRGSIAVVFQDPALFNRSILENIAIGRPGASIEEIEAAARDAGEKSIGLIRLSAKGARRFLAGNDSASRSRVRFSKMRPFLSSTKRHPRSMSRLRRAFKLRLTG